MITAEPKVSRCPICGAAGAEVRIPRRAGLAVEHVGCQQCGEFEIDSSLAVELACRRDWPKMRSRLSTAARLQFDRGERPRFLVLDDVSRAMHALAAFVAMRDVLIRPARNPVQGRAYIGFFCSGCGKPVYLLDQRADSQILVPAEPMKVTCGGCGLVNRTAPSCWRKIVAG